MLGEFFPQFFRFPGLLFEQFSLVPKLCVKFLVEKFAGVAALLGRGVVVVATAVLTQQVLQRRSGALVSFRRRVCSPQMCARCRVFSLKCVEWWHVHPLPSPAALMGWDPGHCPSTCTLSKAFCP